MKKTISLLLMSLFFMQVYAQKARTISKKEAETILNNAWSYIKRYDMKSFTELWNLGDTTQKQNGRAMNKADIIQNFNMIRQYCDTALNQNMKIDYVDVEKKILKGTDCQYWIKAWFKYNEHYYKGFGFYIAYKNGKWIVRGSPSTSTKEKNP